MPSEKFSTVHRASGDDGVTGSAAKDYSEPVANRHSVRRFGLRQFGLMMKMERGPV
jgi:hypothetical protein